MVPKGYVAVLAAVALGAAVLLGLFGIHRWQHHRAVASYAAGEQALAELSLPAQFEPVDESDCTATPALRCLHTPLSPYQAATHLQAVIPSATPMLNPAECQRFEVSLTVRCVFNITLGGQPGEVTTYSRVVLLPARVPAPPGVHLVAPGSRFNSYYDGAIVSVGLTGTRPS